MAAVDRKTYYNAQALTAASNESSDVTLDNGNGEFVGFLKAASVHADTTVTAKIQHSPDGVEWFDLVTFTALVGVGGSEIKQVPAGTTNVLGHTRGVVALAGTTKQATCTLSLNYRAK